MAYVISSECLGCGACRLACPFDFPTHDLEINKYSIPADKCVSCGECADICPISAISPAEGTRKIAGVKINPEKCIGCSLCAKNCPNEAITGEIKSPFVINTGKCIKCGYCATKCKKDAIIVTYL